MTLTIISIQHRIRKFQYHMKKFNTILNHYSTKKHHVRFFSQTNLLFFVEIKSLMDYVFCIIRYLDMHMFKVGTCKVLSVFKGKDKSYPTHYRGITITSALSKSFERVILFYIENDFSHIHYNLV